MDMNNSSLSDGAQQASLTDNEMADTKFGMDGAEANMVKLVDGKLVATADVGDDVEDGQLMNRYTSDEERSLQGFGEKIYENSEAALRTDGPGDMRAANDVMADAELTDNPAVLTPDTRNDETPTLGFTLMVPATPGTEPYPNQPIPPTPDAPIPPTPPMPGPEIPDFPGTPMPGIPEIQEPSQPDRSHEINSFMTFTTGVPGDAPANTGQYAGLSAGPDEGMSNDPVTNDSSRPYDADASDANEYQPGERPQEAAQMATQPQEAMDESLSKKEQQLDGGIPADASETKSTDGLDRGYNDPQLAREQVV
jgi:hypothetical protein